MANHAPVGTKQPVNPFCRVCSKWGCHDAGHQAWIESVGPHPQERDASENTDWPACEKCDTYDDYTSNMSWAHSYACDARCLAEMGLSESRKMRFLVTGASGEPYEFTCDVCGVENDDFVRVCLYVGCGVGEIMQVRRGDLFEIVPNGANHGSR